MIWKKIQVVIIEDSPSEAALLEHMLSHEIAVEVVGKAAGVVDGEILIRKLSPDLAFLDIEINGGDAFDLLDRIKDFEVKPALIFTTSFNEFAIKAIRYAAFEYLLKPINPVELSSALQRYFDTESLPPSINQWKLLLKSMNPNQKIKINTISGFTLVHPDEIIYCEAEGNYTDIHMFADKIITTSMNLGKVEELLPSDSFFRIHRSVTINLKYLSSVNRQKKRCFLKVNDRQFEFCIPTAKIREMERGL